MTTSNQIGEEKASSRKPRETRKPREKKDTAGTGVLIVNADDWGRDRKNTDRILECIEARTVSSASGMVCMEDSDRAAALALEHGIDVGLHLNFTTVFNAPRVPTRLKDHQEKLARYLLQHRFAQVIFHPGLVHSFRYIVETQVEEYQRLYGAAPARFDGHHHMHLCANVVLAKLIPSATLIRRNFWFAPGQKSFISRLYRKLVDRSLSKRHRMVDYFFSLSPLAPTERLEGVLSLARSFSVELETHPVIADEYRFLMGGEFSRLLGDLRIADRYGPTLGHNKGHASAGPSSPVNLLSCAFAVGSCLCQYSTWADSVFYGS